MFKNKEEKHRTPLKLNNTFFDFIAFLLSAILSFFRSIKNLFTMKRIKKNIFFNFLDFLFRIWPKYFWKRPNLYKITSFLGDIFNNIFKNK